MKHFDRILTAMLVCLAVGGCSEYDREELMLLKRDDPRFRNMMEMKSQVNEEIDSMESRLSDYKETMNNKITSMRAAYEEQKTKIGKRSGEMLTKVGENRKILEKELGEAEVLLERKKIDSSKVNAALSDAESVLSRSDTLKFSDAEVRNLQDRRAILETRSVPLAEDIETLTSRVNMLKKKLKYL